MRVNEHQDEGVPPPQVGDRDLTNVPAKHAKIHAEYLVVNKMQARNECPKERSHLVFATNTTDIRKNSAFWNFKKTP